jgi:hypothetical protein
MTLWFLANARMLASVGIIVFMVGMFGIALWWQRRP